MARNAQLVDDYLLLRDHWCFHTYSYQAILKLDGVAFPIAPGFASIIAPRTRMTYRDRGPSEHVYFHFRSPDSEPNAEFACIFDFGERALYGFAWI